MTLNPTDLIRPGRPHVDSYWAATAGEEVGATEALVGDRDVEIAIIGGGYAGLATAYHLGRSFGLSAHVLEAHRIGWGCSGRNGGFCSREFGKHGVESWIRRWGLERARAVFDQGRRAVNAVRHLLQEEAIEAEASADGGLELAHRPNRLGGLAAHQKILAKQFGVEARLLDRPTLHRDYLASSEGHGALLYPDGFALHPLRYVRGLARAAQRHGAVLHAATPVVAWRRDGARHLLRTPGGTVRARQVVIATNGYTNDGLHGSVAGRLLPVLSNILVTRPLTGAEQEAAGWRTSLRVWDTRRLLFYYRLLPDGRILFGARGGIEDGPAERIHRLAWLRRRLGNMLPALAGVEVEYFWNGWVCLSRDLEPHVGSTDEGTVHYALACIGSGVALMTYAGRLLAERLAGGDAESTGPLLGTALPRFPFPALRRLYQRTAYAAYAVKDEWL